VTSQWTPEQIGAYTAEVAPQYGADPLVLLAMFDVEAGFDDHAIGDHGTSFGLEMLHQGGALGTRTPAWAMNPVNAIKDAAHRLAGAKSGADVAARQRPADPAGYAAKIDARLRELRAAVKSVGGSGSVTGDTAGLNASLMAGLRHVSSKVGKTVNVTSGKRSRAEQERLYAAYLNGSGNLAAKPGTSNHESGNAADAYIGGTPLSSYPGAAAAAAEAGLGFPVGGEPWHTEVTGAASIDVMSITTGPALKLGDTLGKALGGLLGKGGGKVANAAGDAVDAVGGAVSDIASGVVNTAGRYVLTIAIVVVAGVLLVKGADRAVGAAIQGGE
jgi:hypothetical protein